MTQIGNRDRAAALQHRWFYPPRYMADLIERLPPAGSTFPLQDRVRFLRAINAVACWLHGGDPCVIEIVDGEITVRPPVLADGALEASRRQPDDANVTNTEPSPNPPGEAAG